MSMSYLLFVFCFFLCSVEGQNHQNERYFNYKYKNNK